MRESASILSPASQQLTAPSNSEKPLGKTLPLVVRWTGPEGEQVVSLLVGSVLRVGRESKNDIVLPSSEMSRHHADILLDSDAVRVRDANSRNGIYCNGVRVASAELVEGAVLRMGEWVGVVARGDGGLREVAPGLLGSSRLEAALVNLRRAAESELNLVLFGETGTGKELVARAVYDFSGLGGKFVPVNCAALAASLVESELFGHERGAFTGADRARVGFVRSAHEGILFLDEIAELSAHAQAALLRVLQEKEVTPVGGERCKVALRVVCASHCDLGEQVKQGKFREDLLVRLSGLVISLPSLGSRREDIAPLFVSFVKQKLPRLPRLSSRFVEALTLHAWPGNVRELKQVADRVSALHHDSQEWQVHHLTAFPSAPPEDAAAPPRAPSRPSLTEADIRRALKDAGGVAVQAAAALEISKQTLYTLVKRYGVDIKEFRPR